MERIHQLTKATMDLVGQEVKETPGIPSAEVMKLRLALEFEELKEKAQGMGLEGSFGLICAKSNRDIEAKCHRINGDNPNMLSESQFYALADTGIVNLLEVFDAALDQRVVASGTDLAFGFQHIIPAGDEEVWRSNMSKFDTVEAIAAEGAAAYATGTHPHGTKNKIDVYLLPKDGYFIIKRKDNHKYLKSLNYSPADLGGILEIGESEVGNAK